MRFIQKYYCFLFVFLFSFCSQTLDFEQTEGYTIAPVFNSSIAFFSIDASGFSMPTGGTTPVFEIEEIAEFKLFQNQLIKNNLVRIDFDFEIENNFNRDFTIQISLLDEGENVIYNLEDLNINANNTSFTQTEIIDVTQNIEVKNFTKVLLNIRLNDTVTPINNSDLSVLNFKSGATIYLETSL
ncbi:hypothetical protein [uncultured Polaribacter sp.]|uniref:hypothetical protein n=1 Tax=uncultured Polaribacter sp. TaxID=174711 RepID=UPI002603C844|nr:hypothetical protein [uncultured Polaribacter sp.]